MEGLNSKVKLDMYKRFGKEQGICMGLGTRLFGPERIEIYAGIR